MSSAMPSMIGMVRRARNTAPTPEVSAIVWRRPYFFGISKSSSVAAWPPTWITLTAKSAPSRARRRSTVVLIRAWAPSVSLVQRATAEAMARWTNDTLGAHARISTTVDRRRALDGADFAVNVIQVGGHAATLLDFEIPKKYGLRQTIADTSGVGAVFRALRTIPIMLGIADDMAELCPDAWMLNYTNPMAMNCWAWYEGSPQQNIVGLCHSIQNTSRQVAEYVGVPPEAVSYTHLRAHETRHDLVCRLL